MAVKIAEAFVEFVAKRGRKFDETINALKKDTEKAADATASSGKTGAQAWEEMTGGIWGASAAAEGAATALGTVVPVVDIAALALKGLEVVGKLVVQSLGEIKKAADELKSLRVIGDVAGYSAAELSTMAFALERAGGAMGDFISLRQSWNAEILDIQFGTGKAGAALRILGVRATDETGKLRDLRDVLPEISAAMREFNDVDRQRLSQALFGGGSETFLKMLAQGNDSLKQLQLDARGLGLQINGATADAGAMVSDTWGTLLDELKTLWQNITATASPIIVPVLTLLISVLGILNFTLSAFNAVFIRPLTALFGMIYRVFQYVNRVVDGIQSRFAWIKRLSDFLYGERHNDPSSRTLGRGSLSAISGGGYQAQLGGLTDFVREMITTAAGRSNIGESQLAELQKHTQLLGTIAGTPTGAGLTYGV